MQKPEQNPQLVVLSPSACGGSDPSSGADTAGVIEDQQQQQQQSQQRKQRPPPLMILTPRDPRQQQQQQQSPMSTAADEPHRQSCYHQRHNHHRQPTPSATATAAATLCVCQHSPMSASSASSASSCSGDPRQLTPMSFSPADPESTMTSPSLSAHDVTAGDDRNPDGAAATRGPVTNGQQSATRSARGSAALPPCASRQPRTGEFGQLPEQLWLRVMEVLDLYDRFQMTQTCVLFRRLFFHPQLWRRVELVCSVGTLPPTTSATVGEREEAPVCLRPSHKRIAAQFGHLFQHVRLYFADSRRHLEPESQQMLSRLANVWDLQGLKLSTSFEELAVVGGPLGPTRYARSGRRMAVEMVRKARGLRHLDLCEWPILISLETSHFPFPPNPDLLLWDVISAERERGREVREKPQNDEEGLLEVLLERETCPELRSLNVARKTFPYHGPGYESRAFSAELRLPEQALRLAAKLRASPCLILTLRQAMLSDQLLQQLIAADLRGQGQGIQTSGRMSEGATLCRRLRVVNCDPVDLSAGGAGEDEAESCREETTLGPCPNLSEEAWRELSEACRGRGGLEVEAVAEVFNAPALRWLLQPHVPLVSLSLHSCSLSPALLRAALQCRATLRSLSCRALPARGLDAALLELARGCPHLRHLLYYGSVLSETILALAAIPRQWVTFSFRQKRIVFPPGREPVDLPPSSLSLDLTPASGEEKPLTEQPPLADESRQAQGQETSPASRADHPHVRGPRAFFPSPQSDSGFDSIDLPAAEMLAASMATSERRPSTGLAGVQSADEDPSNTGHANATSDLYAQANRDTRRSSMAKPDEGGVQPMDGQDCRRLRRLLRLQRERHRKAMVDQLCTQVSALLGYPWAPSDL